MLNTWLAAMLLGVMSSLTALSQSISIKFEAINDGGSPSDAVGTLIDEKGTVCLLYTSPSPRDS